MIWELRTWVRFYQGTAVYDVNDVALNTDIIKAAAGFSGTQLERKIFSLTLNWDLTEVAKRYGYFFAREFGCIYLENRKPVSGRSNSQDWKSHS